MSRNNTIKTLSLATGAVLALTVGGSALAGQANPFGMTEISHSVNLASAADGKCGTAKCGANKPKAEETKCGANNPAAPEGKCGNSQPEAPESKCGGSN